MKGEDDIMNRIAPWMLILICFPATSYSQEQPPQLLFRAAQCLEAKRFLPSSKATKLTLGYFVDEKSYPGDKVVYVIKYVTPRRSDGLVFAVFLKEHDDHQEFNIQNNASFVLSKDEASGVSFPNPPLGGTWTQEHLASAIKQIEKEPRFVIYAKDLSALDKSVSCEAYTDPQQKRKQK